jgi:hypothetical protein
LFACYTQKATGDRHGSGSILDSRKRQHGGCECGALSFPTGCDAQLGDIAPITIVACQDLPSRIRNMNDVPGWPKVSVVSNTNGPALRMAFDMDGLLARQLGKAVIGLALRRYEEARRFLSGFFSPTATDFGAHAWLGQLGIVIASRLLTNNGMGARVGGAAPQSTRG